MPGDPVVIVTRGMLLSEFDFVVFVFTELMASLSIVASLLFLFCLHLFDVALDVFAFERPFLCVTIIHEVFKSYEKG